MLNSLIALIRKESRRVENHRVRIPLSTRTLTRFWDVLYSVTAAVSESTVNHLIAREVEKENPFAEWAPELITKEQRERAEKDLNERTSAGTLCLPEPLPGGYAPDPG